MNPRTRQSLAAFLILANAFAGIPAMADDLPDASVILKEVRFAQTMQDRKLSGSIDCGPKQIPFRLITEGKTIRYEFPESKQTFVMELGEKDVEIREINNGATQNVKDSQLANPVQGTDLTLEDVSLQFLYWKNAKVVGEELVSARNCWKLELHPSRGVTSQYGTVLVWIDKPTGGLLKAECYGRDGSLAMRFTLRSVQRSKEEDGVWLPKGMRVERMEKGKPRDPSPTYLEIKKEG